MTHKIQKILEQFHRGDLDVAAAVAQLESCAAPATAATGDAQVDLDRRRRCGFPEVVFCEGKTSEAIAGIFEAMSGHGQAYFGTRVSPEQAAVVLDRFPDAIHNPVARTLRCPQDETPVETALVAVITAGTSDRPIAEEAVETLRWMGCRVELIVDVGVAGPHRLRENHRRFEQAAAIVVVAGMEGALPSVVGGYVDCPIIAVPTSIGYGASFGGVAALLGMLNSCASNVTVVNIDSGFKGGYVAGMIARKIDQGKSRRKAQRH